MAHPLAPITTSAAISALALETERPSQPEASQQVTAMANSQGSGSTAHNNTPQFSFSSENTLANLNDNLRAWATGLRFDIDPEAQRLVVSIVDSQSGEVLRTVPSEAVIRIAKMIAQLQGQQINTQA